VERNGPSDFQNDGIHSAMPVRFAASGGLDPPDRLRLLFLDWPLALRLRPSRNEPLQHLSKHVCQTWHPSSYDSAFAILSQTTCAT